MTAQMAKDNKHTYFLLFAFGAATGRPSAGRVLLLPAVGVHVSACSAQTGTFHVPACFPSTLERFWSPSEEEAAGGSGEGVGREDFTAV